jgi:hypothetical protein
MLTIRKKSFSTLRTVFGLLAVTLLVSAVAYGQQDTVSSDREGHAYSVAYFTHANDGTPTGIVHIVNNGSTGGTGLPGSDIGKGDLCANIYVLRADQELVECCSCKISPNGMMGVSVNGNLTAMPGDGAPVTSGDIKIVSSHGGGRHGAGLPEPPEVEDRDTHPCAAETNWYARGELEAWISHVRPNTVAAVPADFVTEVDFSPARLSHSEQEKLQQRCFYLLADPELGGLGGNTTGIGLCTCGASF